MTTYRIISSAGQEMGTYEADSEIEALDEMARDAGYADQDEAAEAVGPFDGTVQDIGTIAQQLERMGVADAMDRANELCPLSEREQDWKNGSTTWFFDDGSSLYVCGTEIEAR